MARRNPWKGDGDASATASTDGKSYDPADDCRTHFNEEESERVLILAEWHAELRRAHGFPPEPDPIRAVLAVASEAYMGWCNTIQALIEAERVAALDDEDDVIALPGPRLQ